MRKIYFMIDLLFPYFGISGTNVVNKGWYIG